MFQVSRHPRIHLLLAVAALLAVGRLDVRAARWDDTGIGLPFLRVFTTYDTGTLSHFHCALTARDGMLYVGHHGLLAFDGETWRPLPAPPERMITALAEDEAGRIWIGGDNLLGYLADQPAGEPAFHSVLERLPAEHRADLGSISALFTQSDGTIVAVAEHRIIELRATGTRVQSLPAPRPLAAWRDDSGEIIVVQPGIATLRLAPTGMEPAGFPEPYASAGVDWGLRFPGGQRLFGSAGRLVLQQEGSTIPLATETAALLQNDRVTGAIPLADGFAALATRRSGVLILDAAGRLVNRIDRSVGLPDNRVEHLTIGECGGLVATTAEAVTLFCDEPAATFFDARHGLTAQRIASIVRSEAGLFLANGGRVLQLDDTPGAAGGGRWRARLERPEPVAALVPLGRKLLEANAAGLSLFDPDSGADTILRQGGISALQPLHSPVPALAWVEDSRFLRAELIDGSLRQLASPVEIDRDASGLIEAADGACWVATRRAGVFRISTPAQIAEGKPAVRNYRHSIRPGGTTPPRLIHVGPHVAVVTETGLALRTDAGDRFLPLPGVTNMRVHAISPGEPDHTVWLAVSQRDRFPFQVRIARLQPTAEGLSCELVRLPPLPVEGAPSALLSEAGPAGPARVFWLGLPGRVVRIESPGTLADNPPQPPRIAALQLAADGHSARPLAPAAAHVGFENHGLRFDVSVPSGRLGQRVHLESRLCDFDDDWVPLGEVPSRVFRGLRDGTYRFEARAIDALGRTSPAAALPFTVRPPWWRSAPAYVGYALGLVLFSGVVFLTRLRLARRHREQLEALVAQRTRELAAANAAKTEFLSHINHEIRNPLNGVIGLATMLAQQHPRDDSRQLARSLKACAGYLSSVVDNVLDLARIEAGRIELAPQQFEPRTLVADITEMFRLQVEEAGGRISWSVDPEIPQQLVGDEHRIRQVLVNFTANAARYARGGDVRLSVRRRTQVQNRLTVTFTVADTGPGIAPSDQEHIFERFSRGRTAGETEATRGYGVGLALVRDLASLLGGEADVDSQIGLGAKFRLTIPLALVDTIPTPERPPAPADAAALRVLVIDDQSFNRLILRDHLERLGCKVEESADGPSAHLLLQTRAHQLAFVDLDLPGLDGLNLIRRIRAENRARRVFLVATTAAATRTTEEQVLAAGADAFLPKPIAQSRLAGLLAACIQQPGDNRPGPTPAPPPAAPAPALGEGLFAQLALTGEIARSLQRELDVEAAALATSWRRTETEATRHHAHRIASLGIIARDEQLISAARTTEDAIRSARPEVSQLVDALQTAARNRIRLLGDSRADTGRAGEN